MGAEIGHSRPEVELKCLNGQVRAVDKNGDELVTLDLWLSESAPTCAKACETEVSGDNGLGKRYPNLTFFNCPTERPPPYGCHATCGKGNPIYAVTCEGGTQVIMPALYAFADPEPSQGEAQPEVVELGDLNSQCSQEGGERQPRLRGKVEQ